jgi:hypothetical protein
MLPLRVYLLFEDRYILFFKGHFFTLSQHTREELQVLLVYGGVILLKKGYSGFQGDHGLGGVLPLDDIAPGGMFILQVEVLICKLIVGIFFST